ncbi:unnamed protein product [Cuscuta epithymum]|uniref:RNase H type-1 domain-containing protein n=1 Tax=Cuscuta epithymum TaxID=186058 RepID=A0AAV0ESP5_9ASTE|nr:unnamed protein product [Cuscuta epithymum]CAH9115071.1 unnamed protein product [Cuscuta epithymum]CAH9126183.1 unnamed protein product [Cuscuta epithymum]CAH9138545.1 unnamed protein product [Cuscuta epithymum]CAH9147731.1 unnamed protein product [Cuscuta epithymum]
MHNHRTLNIGHTKNGLSHSFGFLIRNHNGAMIFHHQSNLFSSSTVRAFIEAYYDFLIFCRDRRIYYSNIQIDNAQVFQAINLHCVQNWDQIFIISCIRRILHHNHITISLVNEKVNCAAKEISMGVDVQSKKFSNILKFDAIAFPYII